MRTRRHPALLTALLLGALALLFAPAALAQGKQVALGANLTGGEEVPGPGDEDGRGAAAIVLDYPNGQVCWAIQVEGIDLAATAAHIHEGSTGEPGPPVVPLTPPDGEGKSAGCAAAEESLMNAIRDEPGAYYVNVHTSLFPDGALRGQLAKVTVPETSTVSDGAGAPSVPVLPLVLLGAGAVLFGVGGSLAVARRRIR